MLWLVLDIYLDQILAICCADDDYCNQFLVHNYICEDVKVWDGDQYWIGEFAGVLVYLYIGNGEYRIGFGFFREEHVYQ